MTSWLQDLLRAHPEIAFFLVLGIGYLIGRIAIGGFKIGAVTGTLLAGVIVGQLGVTMSDQVKQCFFLLFLFAIGFRTGPQFFRGLRSDGLGHAALAAIVAIAGLFVAYGISLLFGYDAGTAAGLVAGALTESATIGTAMDAISKLPLAEAERNALENNIPVAFSVTYMLGVAVAAWVLSQLGPRLMRVDLAEECRKLEEEMQGGKLAALPVRREFELRAYAIDPGSPWVGRGVGALEGAAGRRQDRRRSGAQRWPGPRGRSSAAAPGGRRRGGGRATHDAGRGPRATRQRFARGGRQGAARSAGRRRRRGRHERSCRRPHAGGPRRGASGARGVS